eukprot:m.122529 g.122529  ORF g.122529 m.122529 type:complete len:235 (+) comp15548_c0_seq6:1185-1889(+)
MHCQSFFITISTFTPCNFSCIYTVDFHGHSQTRTQFSFWAIMASPLLISANIRNMSAYNLETFKNADVIAINQDPLGKQGRRLVGGDLSGSNNAHVAQCDVSDPGQVWQFGSPASEYIFNAQTNLCLNVDDCGTDLIYYSCVTTGGTCCGTNCYKNMQFTFTNGSLQTPLLPGYCADVSTAGTINLVPCTFPLSSSMTWIFNETTGQVVRYSASPNQHQCDLLWNLATVSHLNV